MKLLILALCAGSCLAQQISNIRVTVTPQQAILRYSVGFGYDTAPAQIELSMSNTYAPLLPDVNGAVVSGSNFDLTRSDTFVAGGCRTVTLGHRLPVTGLDGKNYSLSLPASTTLYYRLTLFGVQYTGSFVTAPIPAGSGHGDPIPADPNNPGNYLYPTLSDRASSSSSVDPHTGAYVRAMTIPSDIVLASTTGTAASGSTALTVASGSNITTGKQVIGAGIPVPDYVQQVNGTAVTLTLPTTAALSNTPITINGTPTMGSTGSPQFCHPKLVASSDTGVSGFNCVVNSAAPSLYWIPPSTGVARFLGVLGQCYNVGCTAGFPTGGQVQYVWGWGHTGPLIDITDTSAAGPNTFYFMTKGNNVVSGVPTPPWTQYSHYITKAVYEGHAPGCLNGSTPCDADRTNQVQEPNAGISNSTWSVVTPSESGAGLDRSIETLMAEFDPTWGSASSNPPGPACCNKANNNNNSMQVDMANGKFILYWYIQQDDPAWVAIFDPKATAISQTAKFGSAAGCVDNPAVTMTTYTGLAGCIVASMNTFSGPAGSPFRYTGLHQVMPGVDMGNGMVRLSPQEMRVNTGSAYQVTVTGGVAIQTITSGSSTSSAVTIGMTDTSQFSVGQTVALSQGSVITPVSYNGLSGVITSIAPGVSVTFSSSANPGAWVSGGQIYYAASPCSMSQPPRDSSVSNWPNSSWAPGCATITVSGDPTITPALTGMPSTIPAQPGDYMSINSTSSASHEVIRLLDKGSDGNTWYIQHQYGTAPHGWKDPCGLSSYDILSPTLDMTTTGVCDAPLWDYTNGPYGTVTYLDPGLRNDHSSYIYNSTYGRLSVVSGTPSNVSAAYKGSENRAGLETAAFGNPVNSTDKPGFNGVACAPNSETQCSVESHPSASVLNPPNSATFGQFVDNNPYTGDFEYVCAPAPGCGVTVTLVAGQLYRIRGLNVLSNYKKIAYFAHSGVWAMREVSGTSIQLATDSSAAYEWCVAYNAGECYAGSLAGDIYFNAPNVANAYCTDDWSTLEGADIIPNDICVSPAFSWTQAVTVQQMTSDLSGATHRTISNALGRYDFQIQFWNARFLPDGSWAFTTTADGQIKLFQVASYTPDSVNRASYVYVLVTLPPMVGSDGAVVEFGYGEQGQEKYYCTARQETCVANSAAISQSSPFHFEGETYTPMPCASGCTIAIPGISGTTVQFRYKRFNSGTLIYTSPMRVERVP